jgi:dsDNA-binding SOS-regulon protein
MMPTLIKIYFFVEMESHFFGLMNTRGEWKLFGNLNEILLNPMLVSRVTTTMVFFILGFLLFGSIGFQGCGDNHAPGMAEKVDFNYDIRPILVQKCFLCHGPDPSSRKANLRLDTYEGATALSKDGAKAIDPGHSEKSMLFYRVNHKDPDIMMPTPESNMKLTEREIALLKKWIDQGAEWKPHWAFIPPQVKPALLQQKEEAIDVLINKKLDANNLTPAKKANKNSLIRRAAFLLTGLPPTGEEIKQFLADETDDAYPKMVDRYLQSPHFGEQWARHWMDLVRYAETKGHEFDYTIPGAWRYRDYLIRAFNKDLPYDQLIREHLAGDLVQNPRIDADSNTNESHLGTVFFALAEGTHSPVDIRKDEADRIDNMIDVTSKTFQALTVSCSRCHDHKFDPISTKEYYALYGVMEGTRFSPVSPKVPENENRTLELKSINETLRNQLVESWLKKQGPVATSKQHENNNAKKTTAVSNHENSNPGKTATAYKKEKAVQVIGNFTSGDLDGWKSDGQGFTRSTTLGDPIFNEAGKLQSLEEGKASSRRMGSGLFGALRSPDFIIDKNFVGVKAAGKKATIRIIIDNFQLIQDPIYGGVEKRVDSAAFVNYSFDVSKWKGHKAYIEIMPGFYRTHVYRLPKDAYIEVRYAIAFDETWASPPGFGSVSTDAGLALRAWKENKATDADIRLINQLLRSRKLKADFPELKQQLQQKTELQNAHADTVELYYGVVDGFGKNSPVFIRGNHLETSTEKVNRSFLSAIPVAHANLNVAGSGRLQLASAITDPKNPLTSRVMVNRIWHHLFGKGIVETVDNFGMQGKLPSHPELLDFLAIAFQQDGYSIKKTIRRIMLSETFQRSVVPDKKAKEQDPANTWLSHYPIRRLEAENIRDAVLAASGQLNKTMLGPSVPVHINPFMNGRGKPAVSGPLDGNGRRSMYIAVRRNFLDPMMMNFDRPNPATTFGKRTATNVPSQSLMMMNDPFVMVQAEEMAKKLLAEKIPAFENRIAWIYERCFSRKPNKEETRDAALFIEQLEKTHTAKGKDNNNETTVWKDYIHALFNMKEFIYLI